MKFERIIAGTRYVAQCEQDGDMWYIQLFRLDGARYSFQTGGCEPVMQHLPAFDSFALTEHDARNQVTIAFGILNRAAILGVEVSKAAVIEIQERTANR